MKTRRILAASTAALLSFASVAVIANADVASGYTDLEEMDEEDGLAVGSSTNVKVFISTNDMKKIKDGDFGIDATAAAEASKTSEGKYDTADGEVLKGLGKSLKKEIGKIDPTKNKVEIVEIKLAKGDDKLSTSPVPIKVEISGLEKAYKVYHVNGENLELLTSSSSEKTDNSFTVSFTTKNFSPFILTEVDLSNAKATDKDNDPTDESDASSAATSDGTTSPDTGIALAIAPVVLAAGAVAVVALKKKH